MEVKRVDKVLRRIVEEPYQVWHLDGLTREEMSVLETVLYFAINDEQAGSKGRYDKDNLAILRSLRDKLESWGGK